MRCFTFVFFIIVCSFVYSQSHKEFICLVLDAHSEFPVPYATIQIKEKNVGVIANLEGDFRLPYNYKIDKNAIVFSSIGYKTKTVDISTFVLGKENIIYLDPKVEALDQVIIQGSKSSVYVSPIEIVRKAIAKIPENYPISPYATIGYYRDYQVVNTAYYNLNEAIIESYDAGFQTDIIMGSGNKNVLYNYTANKDFPRDSALVSPYDNDKKFIKNTSISGQGGNELGILNIHNPIRNYEQLSFSFVYVFKRKFIDNHEFTKMKKVYLNDEVLYEINFKARERLTKASHRAVGKIYISKDDYSIHKLDYAVFEFVKSEPLFEVKIEYKKVEDLMYLNYITFNNEFTISDDFKFDVLKVDYNAEETAFYVTFNNDIDTTTLDRKDFKFRFKKKKLYVESIALINPTTVKAVVKSWSTTKVDAQTDMSLFTHRIKNIYDVAKRKLYNAPEISGYQFREYFVQQVFEDKILPYNTPTINKFKPINEAEVVNNAQAASYWLNTPLKSSKK